MNVAIPPEFEQFVESVIRGGGFRDPTEVVGEGLRLFREREQLHRDVNTGIEQLQRGEGRDGEEVFARLQQRAEEIVRQANGGDE